MSIFSFTVVSVFSELVKYRFCIIVSFVLLPLSLFPYYFQILEGKPSPQLLNKKYSSIAVQRFDGRYVKSLDGVEVNYRDVARRFTNALIKSIYGYPYPDEESRIHVSLAQLPVHVTYKDLKDDTVGKDMKTVKRLRTNITYDGRQAVLNDLLLFGRIEKYAQGKSEKNDYIEVIAYVVDPSSGVVLWRTHVRGYILDVARGLTRLLVEKKYAKGSGVLIARDEGRRRQYEPADLSAQVLLNYSYSGFTLINMTHRYYDSALKEENYEPDAAITNNEFHHGFGIEAGGRWAFAKVGDVRHNNLLAGLDLEYSNFFLAESETVYRYEDDDKKDGVGIIAKDDVPVFFGERMVWTYRSASWILPIRLGVYYRLAWERLNFYAGVAGECIISNLYLGLDIEYYNEASKKMADYQEIINVWGIGGGTQLVFGSEYIFNNSFSFIFQISGRLALTGYYGGEQIVDGKTETVYLAEREISYDTDSINLKDTSIYAAKEKIKSPWRRASVDLNGVQVKAGISYKIF